MTKISVFDTRDLLGQSLELTLKALTIFVKTMRLYESKRFFEFEIILNVLLSCFQFIWISMLWIYDH